MSLYIRVLSGKVCQ